MVIIKHVIKLKMQPAVQSSHGIISLSVINVNNEIIPLITTKLKSLPSHARRALINW